MRLGPRPVWARDLGAVQFQYYLLGLEACRLRFASFGIRVQVLKSVFYSFIFCFLLSSYLVPFVFFIPCSYFVTCTRLKSCTKLPPKKKVKKKRKKKETRDFKKEIGNRKKKKKNLFVVLIHSDQNIVFFCPLPLI